MTNVTRLHPINKNQQGKFIDYVIPTFKNEKNKYVKKNVDSEYIIERGKYNRLLMVQCTQNNIKTKSIKGL